MYPVPDPVGPGALRGGRARSGQRRLVPVVQVQRLQALQGALREAPGPQFRFVQIGQWRQHDTARAQRILKIDIGFAARIRRDLGKNDRPGALDDRQEIRFALPNAYRSTGFTAERSRADRVRAGVAVRRASLMFQRRAGSGP